jgi:hypothetical protein
MSDTNKEVSRHGAGVERTQAGLSTVSQSNQASEARSSFPSTERAGQSGSASTLADRGESLPPNGEEVCQ